MYSLGKAWDTQCNCGMQIELGRAIAAWPAPTTSSIDAAMGGPRRRRGVCCACGRLKSTEAG